MSKQLNEGLLDRFFQGIFKLLFKDQLKQAEQYVQKVSSQMSDDQRADLVKKLEKLETGSRTLRNKIS